MSAIIETGFPRTWRAMWAAAHRVLQSNRMPSTKNEFTVWAGYPSSCQTPFAIACKV